MRDSYVRREFGLVLRVAHWHWEHPMTRSTERHHSFWQKAPGSLMDDLSRHGQVLEVGNTLSSDGLHISSRGYPPENRRPRPGSYRIRRVLTPSCDLACSDERL
jgi:hypothetical protein